MADCTCTRTAARRLVIVQDAVHGVHAVRLAEVDHCGEREQLGDRVRRARLERRLLRLRYLRRVPEQVRRARLVEARHALQLRRTDCLEQPQRACAPTGVRVAFRAVNSEQRTRAYRVRPRRS